MIVPRRTEPIVSAMVPRVSVGIEELSNYQFINFYRTVIFFPVYPVENSKKNVGIALSFSKIALS